MNAIKLNEQIALFRKQRNMTQEELANALGVTNQAVSKWESAQCCPDIQLLPAIAELFHTSVDELLGCPSAPAAEGILPSLYSKLGSLPKKEACSFAFRVAAALHTILFSKETGSGFGWDEEAAIEHAGNAEWGYSCISVPDFTTTMRQGAVFFSDSKNFRMQNTEIQRLSNTIAPFADPDTLKTAVALFQLTDHSENAWAAPGQISEKSGLSQIKVAECLQGNLSPFLEKNEGSPESYRFRGTYGNLIPMLSLFDYVG